MEKYKPYILLGAGIVIALITSVITYNWLQTKTRGNNQNSFRTMNIAAAAIDIPWGRTLKKEMIKTVPFLRDSIPEGSFHDISSLEGRVLITPVTANEPIIRSKLAPEGTSGGVSALVSPKKRAMAVKVDKVIGVSGFIHPGDRVDVLVTLRQRSKKSPVTKTVLENVLVLAAGTRYEKENKSEKPVKVDVITLEVNPDEAEKLTLASTEGRIQLALRNYADSEDVFTKGTTTSTLLASYSEKKKKPSYNRPKRRRYTIEVIKGNTVSKVRVYGR